MSSAQRIAYDDALMTAETPTSTDVAAPRRRGRPLEMSPEEVLEHVRRLADRGDGLFRVHRTHSGLYARARRLFGSWSAAVLAAGLDYGTAIIRARTRALATRKRRSASRRRPLADA
jgi:hypothetical protein